MRTDEADCLGESAVLGLLAGELDAEAASSVEAHLARCLECRELVSELARGLADDTAANAYVAGLVLGGRFRLLRLLGEGGMGAVWAAQHLVTRREVALKLAKGLAGERDRRRFLREARVAGALDHPGIVPIRDAFELDDGTPVLVMDLLVGCSLRDHLREHAPLPSSEVVQLLPPLLAALEAAHGSGVTHRDLKPENIFLVDEAGSRVLRVLDFGIAKLATADEMTGETTRTGEILGTPFYMAPEQAFGERVDARADLWALGVVIYECLVGSRPFVGENLGQLLKAVTTGTYRPLDELRPEVAPKLGRLVAGLLVVDRDERLGTIAAVRATLEDEAPKRSSRRLAIGLSIMTLAVGAAWAVLHRTQLPMAMPVAARTASKPVVVVPAIAPPARPGKDEPRPHAPRTVHSQRAVPVPDAHPDGRLPGGVVGEVPY